jgi:hypothetical protein
MAQRWENTTTETSSPTPGQVLSRRARARCACRTTNKHIWALLAFVLRHPPHLRVACPDIMGSGRCSTMFRTSQKWTAAKIQGDKPRSTYLDLGFIDIVWLVTSDSLHESVGSESLTKPVTMILLSLGGADGPVGTPLAVDLVDLTDFLTPPTGALLTTVPAAFAGLWGRRARLPFRRVLWRISSSDWSSLPDMLKAKRCDEDRSGILYQGAVPTRCSDGF